MIRSLGFWQQTDMNGAPLAGIPPNEYRDNNGSLEFKFLDGWGLSTFNFKSEGTPLDHLKSLAGWKCCADDFTLAAVAAYEKDGF